MLEKQTNRMCSLLKSEDIKKYAGDLFEDFIKAVVFCDPSSVFDAVKDTASFLYNLPSMIFWDKMKRFLYGTFKDYKDQVKLAAKFDSGNEKYSAYVKKLIYVVDEIDDDLKIDYFAQLTRCFLLTELEEDLYFKLLNFIKVCTAYELDFLKKAKVNYSSENTAMVSSLYQHGLFVQNDELANTSVKYVLSDYAKCLKQNCLNFDEGLNNKERLVSYEQLEPLNIVEKQLWGSL